MRVAALKGSTTRHFRRGLLATLGVSSLNTDKTDHQGREKKMHDFSRNHPFKSSFQICFFPVISERRGVSDLRVRGPSFVDSNTGERLTFHLGMFNRYALTHARTPTLKEI